MDTDRRRRAQTHEGTEIHGQTLTILQPEKQTRTRTREGTKYTDKHIHRQYTDTRASQKKDSAHAPLAFSNPKPILLPFTVP